MSADESSVCSNSEQNSSNKRKKKIDFTENFQPSSRSSAEKMKMHSSKAVQVTVAGYKSDKELNIDKASKNYWYLIAKKNRLQFRNALEKNKKLLLENKRLLANKVCCERMLVIMSYKLQLRIALEEKRRLRIENKRLMAKKAYCEMMLEEANYFIQVFKDLTDDTGIDVVDQNVVQDINQDTGIDVANQNAVQDINHDTGINVDDQNVVQDINHDTGIDVADLNDSIAL